MTIAVEVSGLHKRYGSTVAVDGLSFDVRSGEVFCLVGPNGAGKTTTLECIEGHRVPDSGTIRVLGLDPRTCGDELRRRIGIQLQEGGLPARLRVWEALDLFAALFDRRDVPWSLLERLGLTEKRDTYFVKLSGGQKQRLFVALALVNDPEVVFLDELTTGLDPHARRSIWDMIRAIRDAGTTVVLSTHFMDEAETLADRVAIVRDGRLVAIDTPEELIRSVGGEDHVSLTASGPIDPAPIAALPGVTSANLRDGRLLVSGAGDGWIGRLVAAVEAQGAHLRDLSTKGPTLETVYLTLTGEPVDSGAGSTSDAGTDA